MQFSTVVLPLCAALALVHAAPSVAIPELLEAPLPGYKVEPIEWDVEIFPGGERLKTSGTIEKVVHELKAKNPNWESDFNITSAEETSAQLEARGLTKRAEWVNTLCTIRGGEWGYANYDAVVDGIRYINGLGGQPANNAKSCGRVSCSWNTAIWWCNDNNYHKTLNRWNEISDGASRILSQCSSLFTLRFNGQIFERYGWNTIVRGNSAC